MFDCPSLEYKEILLLDSILTNNGIPHTTKWFYDGWQVCYPDDGADRILSAVEHYGSYGHERDLIEIMGLLKPEEMDDGVAGNLIAEDVYYMIAEHWASETSKLAVESAVNTHKTR